MSKLYHHNELIRKRRRKKAIKKFVFFFMLLLTILIILCLKLPYFNVETITVKNNSSVSDKEVIRLSKIDKGSNIFYQNFSKNKSNLKKNPYIVNANISRKLPNIIEIKVKERKAKYYVQDGSKYGIVDKNGIVLEVRDNNSNNKLVKLDGISFANVKSGKMLASDKDKKMKFLSTISDLIDRTNDNIPKMTEVDISDSKNFKVAYGDMVIILGSGYSVEEKLNKALNILQLEEVKSAKGHIDVSFNGNPVVYIQR